MTASVVRNSAEMQLASSQSMPRSQTGPASFSAALPCEDLPLRRSVKPGTERREP
jgi:hypothetical protein